MGVRMGGVPKSEPELGGEGAPKSDHRVGAGVPKSEPQLGDKEWGSDWGGGAKK